MDDVSGARVGTGATLFMVLSVATTMAVALWGINQLGEVRRDAEAWGAAVAAHARQLASPEPGVRVVLKVGHRQVERTWERAEINLPADGLIDLELPAGPWEAEIAITLDAGAETSATVGAEFSGCSFILMRNGRVLLADASEGEPRQRMTIEPESFPSRFATITYRVNGDGQTPVHFRPLWQPESAREPRVLPF